MKILGLTGPSGSGKSTVSKIIGSSEYVVIIDADEIAKELSKPRNKIL